MVIFIASCSAGEKSYPHPHATSEIRDTIKNTDSIFVFEGLPHQMFEAELLKTEKERKDITTIGGFPFYTPKSQVKMEAAAAFKQIISDSNNYMQFGEGGKRCGGFHPDYSVEWSDGGKLYSILFCYGCSEVFIINGKNSYRYDFKLSDDLKKLFAVFESKCPKQK